MKPKQLVLSIGKILLAIAFWLAVWLAVSFRVNNDFLFPSPTSVFSALMDLLQTKAFWLTASISLLRILWGILVSWIIGTVLAYLTSVSALLRTLLSPAISAIKSTPVASFIILALLWLDRDSLPVFITALIVIPIVWGNVSEGIRSVDGKLVEVAKLYRLPLSKRLFRLYVPSVAPYFMAGCKSSLGLAWKAGIAAEILATPDHSIGKELYFSKTYLETDELFAWTLVVILLSLVIERLFVYGLNRLGQRVHVLSEGGTHADS